MSARRLVRFTVPGNPLPKERPRVVNGHAYTPKRTVLWERQVRSCWPKSEPPFTGDVLLAVRAYRGNRIRVDGEG
jgi:hypothetical protein